MRAGPHALLMGLLASTGCAHAPPEPLPAAPVNESRAPEAHRVKMAVLPVESDAFPKLAAEVNGRLHDVQVGGVDDYFISKVTLEVVQLSIECVDPTDACYTAVGKSLLSERLLLAQIAPQLGKRHQKSVRLILTFFDVTTGAAIHAADRVFKSEEDAVRGARDLLDEALAASSGATTAAKLQ